jgi:Rps23 Pro-64 3,4-dihydroxylase Tpa1-like proline 4-hydroxylase
MVYLQEMDGNTGLLDARSSRAKGRELAAGYALASPFPHAVIDNFLPNELLEKCLIKFPTSAELYEEQYDKPQERLKYSFNPDALDDEIRQIFYSFNSRPFVKIVENITGIKGLIADPYFQGGGFHEIKEGGHLSIHADFNHHKPMNLERRVNVLIYLNKDWKSEYGGQLELWDDKMTTAMQSIIPLFNRCVIFNTTSGSNHGNPNPVKHPAGMSRKSIALYYYTATWQAGMKEHTTQFRVRPGSEDNIKWSTKFREIAMDYIPPIVTRKVLLRNLSRRGANSNRN